MSATKRELSPDLPAWEKQPDETDRAYQAFLTYRDLDQRKLRTVTDTVGAAHDTVKEWSASWQWAYRVAAWDRHVYAAEAQDLVRYRVNMNRRQRDFARDLQDKIEKWLKDFDLKDLKPADARALYDLAVRVEREATGSYIEAQAMAAQQMEQETAANERGNPLEDQPLHELLGLPADASEFDVSEALSVLVRGPQP